MTSRGGTHPGTSHCSFVMSFDEKLMSSNSRLTKYKANGTILSKEEIMPCAPYRGALDHDVPYISVRRIAPS
jgi:hypothetical protein